MALPRLIRSPFAKLTPQTPAEFSCWLAEPLGASILAQQQAVLAEVLPRLPGTRALQCSVGTPPPLLSSCVMPLTWTLSASVGADLQARPSQLPIPPQCLDLVVLHHSLDFEDDPHLLLGQVSRALQPGGALVVIGFQPLSLWGLARLLRRRRSAPWSGRFIRPHRVSDWLQVLACEVEGLEGGEYGLPRARQGRLARLWSRIGRRLWPQHGAFYVLVARKRAAMMRPLRPRFTLPEQAPNVIAVPMARWQRRQRPVD